MPTCSDIFNFSLTMGLLEVSIQVGYFNFEIPKYRPNIWIIIEKSGVFFRIEFLWLISDI
jgi:hypothetical protein